MKILVLWSCRQSLDLPTYKIEPEQLIRHFRMESPQLALGGTPKKHHEQCEWETGLTHSHTVSKNLIYAPAIKHASFTFASERERHGHDSTFNIRRRQRRRQHRHELASQSPKHREKIDMQKNTQEDNIKYIKIIFLNFFLLVFNITKRK